MFGAKSYKSAGNKKNLRNKQLWKGRRLFRASNENRPSRASPKTFRSGQVPPTPVTCHSPMTDISVIRPLRWSFWWQIYPSYGTQAQRVKELILMNVANVSWKKSSLRKSCNSIACYGVPIKTNNKYWVKLQIFVRYPFSYFWLETGSYELIFVLSKASK